MLSSSGAKQKIQNDSKPKKTFTKSKNKSNHNLTSRNPNEMLKENISTKASCNTRDSLDRLNIFQSNKSCTLLKHINKEQDTKILKPFTSTLQEFPELKVYNNNKTTLSKFRSEDSAKIEHNKSWGDRQEKNGVQSLSYPSNNVKSESDFCCERKKLTENEGNHSTGILDISKEQHRIQIRAENCNEKQLEDIKEIPIPSTRSTNKKKRGDPVFINLQDILNITKNRTKTKPQRFLKSKFQRCKDTEQLSGNYLDSSNPKRLRGKHREVKKKTLTNLKLAIIKERIIKTKLREKSIGTTLENEQMNFINSIDFKTEIQLYLNKLNEKKLKKADSTQNKVKNNNNCENINSEINSCEKNKKGDKIIPSVTHEGKLKFSSKFREYCDNIITPDLNSAVFDLIKESVYLQDKSFLKDPIKAKARKRHVSGMREVRKYLILKKVKLIVIAPNLEKLQMEGSLYDVISDLKSLAETQKVPYAFALDRYKLGRCTKKNLPVSAFAILSYEGIEESFYKVFNLLQDAKAQFSKMMEPTIKEDLITAEVNAKMIASFISAFQGELKISDDKDDSALK